MVKSASPASKFRYNCLMQLKQAFQLLQQGQLDQAKSLCTELIKLQPDQPRALMLMSAILHRQGDQQQAVEFLLKAADLQANDTAVQLQLVRALRNMGALSEAGQLLNPLDKNHPEVALSVAQLAWQGGQYSTALSDFAAALQRWPENRPIALAYTRALLRLGQLDDAEHTLQQALGLWPEEVEFNHLQAVLHLDQGNPAVALEYLQNTAAQAGSESMASRLLQALQILNGQAQRITANRENAIE